MHPALILYGGPDQIMTVTSGLAGLVGVLLIFWNKLVTAFFRLVRVFRPSSGEVASVKTEGDTLKETP